MSAWIEIPMLFRCFITLIVALYMSAWIEIIDELLDEMNDLGRTLHECVD